MKKALFIIGTLLFVTVGMAILYHHWIYKRVALFVQDAYYAQAIRAYDQEFPPLNNMFKTLGFRLVDKTTLSRRYDMGLYEIQGCNYYGEGELVECRKQTEYQAVSVSDFKTQWLAQAPKILSYLEQNGWHEKSSDFTAYDELFKTSSVGNDTESAYDKYHGKVYCSLTLHYTPKLGDNPEYGIPESISINEHCERELTHFNELPYN